MKCVRGGGVGSTSEAAKGLRGRLFFPAEEAGQLGAERAGNGLSPPGGRAAELQQLGRPRTGGLKEENEPSLGAGQGGTGRVAQPALHNICFHFMIF